ncbi:fibrinogen C domain-containing protein 1 isoform X1 [Neoarius graeffei]|uniref:fibrinogen C domain-containing protein 1 isoform X1 n=1 Tax=Neoarius graeffei TaxID=443677 RepID=UPI00298C8630|nr:fibrinogen C domain-containing protein 1 isoform X1 [Neoarius graeffei]
MESSPFAELVHALATAQQSQHQALLTLQKEQEERFEALVLAQQEDRQALRHLLASAGSTSAPTAGPSPLTVTKMGPQDDPEAFITLFEQVAEASGWPMEQRAARLLPLLTGEAQLAALQLPADRRLAYADLRWAVLQRMGCTPEQQRQRFRALRLEEVGQPFAFGQQLRDACWRWLRANNHDAEGILDQVALEQFVAHLPAGTVEWVRCHRPASLDQAVELAEDHLVAVPAAGQQRTSSLLSSSLSLSPPPPVSRPHPIPPPRRRGPAPPQPARRTRGALPFLPSVSVSPPPQVSETQITGAEGKPGPVGWRCGEPGHLQQQGTTMEVGAVVRIPDAPEAALDRAGAYRIPVSIQGATYQALVDSGCNQTSIRQSLVQNEALGGAQGVRVLCVHGDVHRYPLVPVHIIFRGEKFIVKAAVNPRLTHSLILGTDWPGFRGLMTRLVESGSCHLTGGGPGVALAGAAVTEPSTSSPHQSEEPPAPPLSIGESLADFPLEQSRDETLRHAFDQVRVIDGQTLLPNATPSFPYFAIMKDILYRVTQDTQTKERVTQLLIPKSRRELVFQAAHFNPMAGHLGQDKTLARIMA